jgi:hypothetical protein
MLLWRGLNDMAREDAVKSNDGRRMISHWKFDMMDLANRNHPKYLIHGQRILASVGGGASPRLAHQLTWNRTLNVKGGSNKNKAKYLYCEHPNRAFKRKGRHVALDISIVLVKIDIASPTS